MQIAVNQFANIFITKNLKDQEQKKIGHDNCQTTSANWTQAFIYFIIKLSLLATAFSELGKF
jgi:hypothetical protein